MGNLQTANHSDNPESETNPITTWNGAKSYSTINDPLVELYFKSVRNIPCTDYRCINVKKSKKDKSRHENNFQGKSIENYFDEAWEADQTRTLKFVFHLRDCREGKGEKKLFRALVRHMRERNLTQHLEKNLEHIPFYGSWKDLSLCFFGTDLESKVVKMFANQLKIDSNDEHPSLCAKYAPSENGAIDSAHKASGKIAKELECSVKNYRKLYLSPLRAELNVVERQMCSREWQSINYENVPSIAGSNYKKAFKRHDDSRYGEYLKLVQKGEKKMNTSVLMPYQMVSEYLRNGMKDETTEAQWKSFVDDRKRKWPVGIDVLPLIDVSGSMFNSTSPQAVEVAVSLGLLFSLLNSNEKYNGKFITFHEHPELLQIQGDSLHEKVEYLKSSRWGGNTDFAKAFRLILTSAKLFELTQEQLPKILLVLSDMQFDDADNKTNWELLDKEFSDAGYQRPTMIFWNLNGDSLDFPIPSANVPNCLLLSGFNDTLMYSVLDGSMPTPLETVRKALDNPRYDLIQLAE